MNRFIELKRSLPINFTRELRGYFQKIYKTEREDDYDGELKELDKLRQECANPSICQNFMNNTLLRYYLQLIDLEHRVNLDAAGLKVTFAWYNCSAGDDKKIIVSAANIRFEEACVLFNVAVSYIQFAGMESTSTAEGLKKACNYYMMACGVFQFISENLTSHFNVPTPADVSPMTLSFLTKWTLAAAQECFVLKGILEKTIKDGMMAKLSLATGHMYETAKELGEELGIGSIYGKSLAAYLLGKATYYKSLSQVKKAAEALASNRYGEEISRLNEATNILNRCKEHKKFMDASILGLLDNLAGQIVRNLERAIKDNSIIYHETIPAITSLPDIGQAIVARATAMPDWSKDSSVPSRPILARLVPESIRNRSVQYYTKRNALVADLYSRLQGLKQAEQEIMKECNLPSSLEVSQTSMGLPPSILEKSQYVRANGGVGSLQSSLTTVEALKNDALQVLKQVEVLLSEERINDTRARQEFGSKWTRPESEMLNEQLQQALDLYKKSFIDSRENDAKLHKEFDEAFAGITALDSSQTELEEAIPSSTTSNSQRGDVSLSKNLRNKLNFVNEFERRREDLIKKIEKFCESDGIEDVFTSLGEEVLGNDETVEQLISSRLNSEEFLNFISETDSIECEQQIGLSELRQLATSFSASLTLNSPLEERKNALQTLETAFVSFKNLSGHLQSAISHYSNLLDLLQKLRENTRDFTVSRGIEMEELKSSLMRSSIGTSMMNAMNSNRPNSNYDLDNYDSEYPEFDYGASSNNSYNNFKSNNMNNGDFENGRMSGPIRSSNGPVRMNKSSNDFNYNGHNNYNDEYSSFTPMGQSYMMPPLRSNPSSGSSFSMPQTNQPFKHTGRQHNWRPGMPVQYANNNNDNNFDEQSHSSFNDPRRFNRNNHNNNGNSNNNNNNNPRNNNGNNSYYNPYS